MSAVHKLHAQPSNERNLAELRRDVVKYAQELAQRGWVANHDGNITVRLPGWKVLATPTALSKRLLTENDLILLDRDDRVIQGGRKAFSELKLHRAVYDARADVFAVVHTHAPCATALAVAGIEIEPKMLAEAVVSLGEEIPLLPYRFPNSAEQIAEVRHAAVTFDALTIANHGVFAWGDDLEQAFLRAELVEHLAAIQLRAMQVGKITTVPQADIQRLLQARTKAGLGVAGRASK